MTPDTVPQPRPTAAVRVGAVGDLHLTLDHAGCFRPALPRARHHADVLLLEDSGTVITVSGVRVGIAGTMAADQAISANRNRAEDGVYGRCGPGCTRQRA